MVSRRAVLATKAELEGVTKMSGSRDLKLLEFVKVFKYRYDALLCTLMLYIDVVNKMQFIYLSYIGDQTSRRDAGHLQTGIDNQEVHMSREILQNRGTGSLHAE